MRSPGSGMAARAAYGFAWQFWQRHRWGLGVFLMALFAASLFANTIAAGRTYTAGALAVPLVFGLLYVMAIFTYPDADIASSHSGFPVHLMLLPLRTRDLVLWPMLYGGTAVAFGWVLLARFVLHPLGISAPLAWPAVMFAAQQACLQALFWSPFGLPYLRMLLALTLLPLLSGMGLLHEAMGLGEGALISLYSVSIVFACFAAQEGLGRARRGESPELAWFPTSQRTEPLEPVTVSDTAPSSRVVRSLRLPFASSERAQLWAEWRRNGLLLPLMVTVVCLLLSVPLFLVGEVAPLDPTRPPAQPGTSVGSLLVNVWFRTVEFCLPLPLLFASLVGCGARRADTRRTDRTLHLFLATRPMTSPAMIAVKLRMAALSTLAAWGVVAGFVAVWLCLSGQENWETARRPLWPLLWKLGTPETALTTLAVLCLLVLWTWRNQVLSLFADLSGRVWIVYGYPLVVYGSITAALSWLAQGGEEHQTDWRPLSIRIFVWTVLCVKLLWSGWAVTQLVRRRVMTFPTVRRLLALWFLAVGGMFGLLAWLRLEALPYFVPGQDQTDLFSDRNLLIAAVLFVPLARLLTAPLMLDANRHR